MNFNNKTAVVTGAASGMGLLFAQNFANLCGNVVMCDVNGEKLKKYVDEINEKGNGKAIGVICDVRDYGKRRKRSCDGSVLCSTADGL